MNKNIKDYLHLYLGCEIKSVKQIGGVEYQKRHTMDWQFITSNGLDRIDKLILRQLSDITEEEMLEFVLLDFGSRDIAESIIKKVTKRSEVQQHIKYGTGIPYTAFGKDNKVQMVGVISAYELSADRFRYLLSKNFDLFGLIESGLAIDKTTLTSNETK